MMFHDLPEEAAWKAFSYLAKKYNIISLEAYLEARRQGAGVQLPPKPLIITLDDGHISNYTLLPIVRKLQIPITIFLCSGLVNTNRHYWFKYKRKEVKPERLKKIPNNKKLQILAEAGFYPELEFDLPQALSKAQIMEMKPLINFQAHTIFHPCLPKCDKEEAWREIAESKQTLEEEYGFTIDALAYPNGDYSDRDIDLVKRAGYEYAITVDYGFNTLQTDPFKLKRLSIDDTGDIDAICIKATGIWTFLMALIGKQRWHGHADSNHPLSTNTSDTVNTALIN
ncbi:MAG: polysaccharide deacetylase family protein [Saprospirales bacterium]|nr:polysaccharide deacetylase family protein [Saprospirales bacterium]